MKVQSVSDAAKKWNVSKPMVTQLCREGRVEGAKKLSGVWILPIEAKKPIDGRQRLPQNLCQSSICATPIHNHMAERNGSSSCIPQLAINTEINTLGKSQYSLQQTMTLKQHKFIFNSGCFKLFPKAEFIEIHLCAEARELLVKAVVQCDDNPDASRIRWCYLKDDGRIVPKMIQNRAIVNKIYEIAACQPDKLCRFLGYQVDGDPDGTLRIYLGWHFGAPGLYEIDQQQEPS